MSAGEYVPSTDDREVALMRLMLRDSGASWDEEHSEDGSNFGPGDMAYMQSQARDYIVALEMLERGANPEQVEAVVCDGEVFISNEPTRRQAHDARIASEAAEKALREASHMSTDADFVFRDTGDVRDWLIARADRLAAQREGRES